LQTAKGYSPLHFTYKNQSIRATCVLLNRGAKFDVYDKEGHTLLHFARTKGKL